MLEQFKPYSSEVRDALDEIMQTSAEFTYSISEGGWISKDRSVILVTNRFPYNGKLTRMREDVSQEKFDYWFNYVEAFVSAVMSKNE